MFQFPEFASASYVFRYRYRRSGGFPHSEIPGSKLVCQLPEAYRRLPRPSSPSVAKASTVCAYSLDHITPNSLKSYFQLSNVLYVQLLDISAFTSTTSQIFKEHERNLRSFQSQRPEIKTLSKNPYFWPHQSPKMVEPGGIEPPTSCVQGRRSPS